MNLRKYPVIAPSGREYEVEVTPCDDNTYDVRICTRVKRKLLPGTKRELAEWCDITGEKSSKEAAICAVKYYDATIAKENADAEEFTKRDGRISG